MKAAQLAVGMTYEDRKSKVLRKVQKIQNGIVHFEESGTLSKCGAQDFAEWAARPMGAKKPKKEK